MQYKALHCDQPLVQFSYNVSISSSSEPHTPMSKVDHSIISEMLWATPNIALSNTLSSGIQPIKLNELKTLKEKIKKLPKK